MIHKLPENSRAFKLVRVREDGTMGPVYFDVENTVLGSRANEVAIAVRHGSRKKSDFYLKRINYCLHKTITTPEQFPMFCIPPWSLLCYVSDENSKIRLTYILLNLLTCGISSTVSCDNLRLLECSISNGCMLVKHDQHEENVLPKIVADYCPVGCIFSNSVTPTKVVEFPRHGWLSDNYDGDSLAHQRELIALFA